MKYPNWNGEAEVLKVKAIDDQIKTVNYKREEYDLETILKGLNVDKDDFKNNKFQKKDCFCYNFKTSFTIRWDSFW